MASDKGKKSSKTVTTIPANDDGTEKKRALDIALAGIEKQFGKGAVIRMGERASRDIQVIPTGCLDLDMALGVGGLPRGRVVEIYGPESSGKTTVALHCRRGGAEDGRRGRVHRRGARAGPRLCAEAGRGRGSAVRLPAGYRRAGAGNLPRRWCVPARSTSWSSTRLRRWCPKAEIDGEMGDSFVGLQARLMSQALRKLTGIVNKTELDLPSSSTSCARRSA